MKTLVHFGAGSIGRSLVGTLFSQAGWRIIFVDADEVVVEALQQRDAYTVTLREHERLEDDETMHVSGFAGLHISEKEAIRDAVAQADLLATAVSGGVLPTVIAGMAEGLQQRIKPVSILLCENLRGAATVARKALTSVAGDDLVRRVGFVETSIGKMVPIMPAAVRKQDPLAVWAEKYNRIVADRHGFVGVPPDVPGLVLKDHFLAHVDCKLYMHNMGHAAAAYHGFLHGYGRICDALRDPWIYTEVHAVMDESARALAVVYPDAFTAAELIAHRDDLLARFDNPALGDTVYRVGRDLPRKLAPGDRCIGALALATRAGVDPEHIARAIAAALCFRATNESNELFPADAAFHGDLDRIGPCQLLRQRCQLAALPSGEILIERIRRRYEAYRQDRRADVFSIAGSRLIWLGYGNAPAGLPGRQ